MEQKLAVCRDGVRKKDIEHRLTVQKLEAENRKLRHLLFSMGLRYSWIDEYLRRADNPVMAQKVAIPILPGSDPPWAAPHQPSKDDAGSKVQEQPTYACTTQAAGRASPDPRSHDSESLEKLQKCQPVCTCPPEDDDSSAWPADEDVLNTTLCAIAVELINQYNTRGVEMEEIGRRLWAGFRRGLSSGGGCRVQNQVLFQVLDEISNG